MLNSTGYRMAGKPKARRASDLQKSIEAKQHKIHKAWAERHRALAADERRLRQENRAAHREFGRTPDGTPETHAKAARTVQGALSRAYLAGHITIDQLGAACDIAQVHERIGADVAVRTISFETRVDRSPAHDGTFFERLAAVRAEVAYTAWRKAIDAPALVLTIVAGDTGITVAARQFGMRDAKARRLLIAALDQWPQFIGQAIREVDEATLLAAQAGLL